MSFSTLFLDMMPSTISVTTRSGHDNYGQPSFSTASVSYRARIVEKPGFVRSRDGEEVGYSHTLWVRSTGSVSITATDKITLPDGTAPPIVSVERYPDEDGENHCKILMGH